MTHGDDAGLMLPPKIAPIQVSLGLLISLWNLPLRRSEFDEDSLGQTFGLFSAGFIN